MRTHFGVEFDQDSLRVATCRRCGQRFFLCRFCDRGDRYCGQALQQRRTRLNDTAPC
jgi:hypothetical protein